MAVIATIMIIFALGLIFTIIVKLTAELFSDGPKLTRPEKRELEKLRDMRDTLLTDALDRVEVEPFAATVIDTIRQTQREITK